MRLLHFGLFFALFLPKFGKCKTNLIPSSREDEWNSAITWLESLVRSVKENKYFQEAFDYYEDESSGKVDEDELFASDSRIIDAEEEWKRLVNQRNVLKNSSQNASLEEEIDGETAIRGASLAFVFDSTGSMGGELRQVKSGATKILAALRDHPDAPIYNYIWVPFKDPG